MSAPSGGEAAPTLAELRARLLALPGELRALGVAVARGEMSPAVGDELGRLLDAEGEVLAAVLAVCSPPRRLSVRLLRVIEGPPVEQHDVTLGA